MQVFWKDSRGLVRKFVVRCLDLSAEGARLETDVSFPGRASISLHSARYGNLGTASVRSCVRHTLKYWVGVEFTGPLALAGAGRKRCLEEMQP